ncbi:unnamed protein product [Parnassius apollo]|uniref:(apollo) hypothetical protein n=1 Tax=Parnassius apollo TaxID=110799 RepID=A0A8S3WAZ1_PARAO|nr:unnamed protein product [Parnassius apollo]
MAESKSILHELYVFSEWKPEPEYLQKHDNILPENISAIWRWIKFFGPKKSLVDSVTAHKEKQQKWHIALGDEGKVLAVLTDNILEIRTKRTEYATIAARTTVSRDPYAQWRKLVWSPDCSFLVLAYGNGVVSFFDLTASNLFNIPADCSRPGGLECTDNTHAVSDIIFMPLRVKDTKWRNDGVQITDTADTVNITMCDDGVQITDTADIVNITRCDDGVQITDTADTVNITRHNDGVQITDTADTVNITMCDDGVQITDTVDTVNITKFDDGVHITDTADTVNITMCRDDVQITDTVNTVNITRRDDGVQITDTADTVNITTCDDSVQITDTADTVNITRCDDGVQITDTADTVNITRCDDGVQITDTADTVNITRNWEVLVVTFDGRLRGYVVSQTDGYKLRHSFRFPGGVAALAYCPSHDALYVAGVPRGIKDPSSPLIAGITAWRILNDDPFYKLSVVSDQLEAQLANERFQLYIPFVTSKHLNFIVRMELSSDSTKLVCVHCNGDVSVWRLPLLKLLKRWPLTSQPGHDLRNPLVKPDKQTHKDVSLFYPYDVNWWSNEEIILSRFSGAVSVCDTEDMVNILGKKPEFFQGTPQVTRAYHGAFMSLECESNVLPAKKSRSDESMEVVKVEEDTDDSMLELTKELFKTILYAITDMETFQPKPKKITVVSRIYRLLGVKSTTPTELFSRKIESGNYSEALNLAETFGLDSDLVYQQQWRKNPVSTEAIQKYLSKVSKKIWAVHQCVDRLPETLPAAKELLQFGLELTNERILDEINKDKGEDELKDPDDITLEDLNAYTSELLRCRHVMLFYKERLRLYEEILKWEKSTYIKDEYDRLRSNSIVHSAMEIAKEGRIEALTCLWPHIKTIAMKLEVLGNLPETINPLDYQHLLPTKEPFQWFDEKSPIKIKPSEVEKDWCRKEIFRSIWSSNWSEDASPEAESAGDSEYVNKCANGCENECVKVLTREYSCVGSCTCLCLCSCGHWAWYEQRAREVEQRSGLASHALALVTIAAVGGAVPGLDRILFHLLTLVTLLYDLNLEGVALADLEPLTPLETCTLLMKMSTPATFVSDLKQYVIPYLKRYENLTQRSDACLNGLMDFLESISVDDLSSILLVLQSPNEFELDIRTHLELVERCLFAHNGTDQLDMACDLLNTILKESDGSISDSELVRRAGALERLVAGAARVAWRGVRVAPRDLRDMLADRGQAARLLARLARELSQR